MLIDQGFTGELLEQEEDEDPEFPGFVAKLAKKCVRHSKFWANIIASLLIPTLISLPSGSQSRRSSSTFTWRRSVCAMSSLQSRR
jgi:hypothetical protein